MRVAALYDIHGNLPALEAVLREVEEAHPDLIVVGGDIVPGPFSAAVLERLLELGERVRFIHGNCEREVVAAFDGKPFPASRDQEAEAVRIAFNAALRASSRQTRTNGKVTAGSSGTRTDP